MRVGILNKITCLLLLIVTCTGATTQRSTLSDNFGVGQERTLVSNNGSYFASDPANADQNKRFVLGFDVTTESKTVRLFIKRAKGRNYDNNAHEAKYFTLSSCALDDGGKCGKQSAPVPLRSVEVEVGKAQTPSTILIANQAPPLASGARPYYDVYSPTFSPKLLIKVSNEQQQKVLRSLLEER